MGFRHVSVMSQVSKKKLSRVRIVTLIIRVSLHDLIPYFLPGDSVKDRWSDSFGMVVAIDHDDQKVTFLDKEANAEVRL